MDPASDWIARIGEALTLTAEAAATFLPNLVAAVGVVLAGWVAARVIRLFTIRLTRGLDRQLERHVHWGGRTPPQFGDETVVLIGRIAFWVIMLIALTVATSLLGLEAFTDWLTLLVARLPTILTGLIIIAAGVLFSGLIGDVVTATARSASLPRGDLFGRGAQLATLFTAFVIGVDQIGIDISFLVTLVDILVAAVLGGLALAFAFGAREFVANLIGAHYFRRAFEPGQIARIGDIEGEIIEITPTVIILDTDAGRTTLPAARYQDQVTVLVPRERQDG